MGHWRQLESVTWQCDAGGCGMMRPVCQVRKAVSNVNASCKVCHFCVLEQLQAVHTESSTRNAGGNLFGTVSSVSCAKSPSGSSNHMQHFNACGSTQTKPFDPFAICVFCTSRKWKKEVRAQAAQASPALQTQRCLNCLPSRLNQLNIPCMSVAYHVPAMNHLRFTPRAGSLCQLATFQNAAVSGSCDDEQFLKLSRWPVDFAVAGPPRTLASSHPTLQNKSATQNLQDCPFECFGASRIVSLCFFNSAGQSSCSFWRVYDSPLAQAARRFAWIVATWEDRFNSLDWFNIAFDCGCTSGSNADMFKRFFQWSGAKRARKRQLQLEFVLTCLEWIVLLHFVLPGFDPACGAAAWLTPKALYCFVEEEMWYNRVCIQLRILTICTSSSERNL